MFSQISFAQVSHCTDGGCTQFQLECENNGGVAMCLNANTQYTPSEKEIHLCEVALAIMEKNCQKANDQPCIVAEDRVLDRCFYLPLTVCATPLESIDFFNNYPDACYGPCDDIAACNVDLP